jgi:hypothetical protein
METQNYKSRKVVCTAPSAGAQAILCRPQTDGDLGSPIEFAIVDLAFWGINDTGEMLPYVFDSELGKPDSLECLLLDYGGTCAVAGILESKSSSLQKEDMDRLERAVRQKQSTFIAYRDSPDAKAYRERIRARVNKSQLSA